MGIKEKGFTLIEAMVTLTVFSLLLAFAKPSVQGIYNRMSVTADIETLRSAITTARILAIHSATPHTLCPLNNSGICKRQWNKSLTLFADLDRNRILDGDDYIIKQIPAANAATHRDYPRTAISFDHNGYSGGFNGSLQYCHSKAAGGYDAAALIVSRQGRIRQAQDTDNNGLPNLPNRNDVQCPG